MIALRPARARGAAALVAAAFATAALAAPPGRSSPRLVIEAPRWALEGRALALGVEPRGALAGRPLTLVVMVDGRAIDRVSCDGGRATLQIAAEHLAPGLHEVGVKTGTESSFVPVEVVARRVLWLPAGLALLLAALAILGLRRRRRRAG